MSIYFRKRSRELVGVFFLGLFLLLTLSLTSHNGLDLSASVSSSTLTYENYIGRVGAWISDLLFQMLGLSAFCLPIPLLLIGYRQIRSRPINRPFIKLTGTCLSIVSLSTLLVSFHPQLPDSVNFMPGGILGILISDVLLQSFNHLGTLIVATTTLVFSLILITRFSLNSILECLDQYVWEPLTIIPYRYTQWKNRRADRQKLAQLNKGKVRLVAPSLDKGQNSGASLEKEHRLQEHLPPTVKMQNIGDSTSTTEVQLESFPATKLDGQVLRTYRYPRLDFLKVPIQNSEIDEKELIERAQVLSTKYAEFDVHGRVLQIHPGPVVTTFEFKPDPGIKYSRITNLADDLSLALKAESVRIERIPGKNTVGIEVPNLQKENTYLREIIGGTAFQQSDSQLTLALGRLINGNTYVTDLKRMPHLLIAGATGSGKSVALNCMVCSILYKSSPQEVRFIMIDPKRLELGIYEGIPHLLTPIVTDPKQAAHALNWAVSEMERRYKLLAEWGVRSIDQYNKLLKEAPGEDQQEEPLPYIILIVDELADLMMTAGKEVEKAVTRLAQMARAIGIHLILATQRPSVDVLTGLIKANFPCRISFRVSSKIDSRTILDCNGAEQLLGQGDMLFLPPGTSRLIRIHGAFINSKEIDRVTDFLKKQAAPEYQDEVLAGEEKKQGRITDLEEPPDELYNEAARFLVETGRASTSLLQRRLRIGYGRAARILDMMEREGLISAPDGSRPRQVLVPLDYFEKPDNS